MNAANGGNRGTCDAPKNHSKEEKKKRKKKKEERERIRSQKRKRRIETMLPHKRAQVKRGKRARGSELSPKPNQEIDR
eukprot:CAMPEP_0114514834 /NCGR_PEP_ID=MMETSP0109-20121206/16378_1 /TAXON_ID=29199 /ORGANISM="Chlorarachnion reptans, Strain CCCM449" /LENGTH=77 /DNA_ID=CAMNT_0001694927 /DNA_START=39 /DNA_END=268 /DNA_ORIENTATION=+